MSAFKIFGGVYRVAIPPELADEASLLAYLQMSPAELKKIWWHRGRMYHHFQIAKGNGKIRIITAPDDRLKLIQRKIVFLLNSIYRPRNPVHGFVKDRSIKSNAESHIKSKFVLNIDVQNYFPSITENRVEGVLSAVGMNGRVAKIIARICCNNGHLPQGAPSSPVLSNMICFRLDRELLKIAKDARCIYTRYADDISFSSYQPLSLLFKDTLPPSGPISPDMLAEKLTSVIATNGFTINPNKAYYADRNSRRTVTGLKINEILNVDRKFVRNIRAALNIVETHGLPNAQQIYLHMYNGTTSIVDHLQGKIAWLGHIRGQSDPVFRAIAERFNLCFPNRAIKIAPTNEEVQERSVWVVEYDDGLKYLQGSAFFLRGVGLVTAAHCVKEVHEVEIHHPTKPSNKFKATIAKRCDPKDPRDLAILAHSIPTNEYYELDYPSNPVSTGGEATAMGYPGYGPGDQINVRTGTVSSLPIKSAVQLIEVTQKLLKGMSGGPLIDKDGEVIGITHKGGPHEPRDFAIHIDVLKQWIAGP